MGTRTLAANTAARPLALRAVCGAAILAMVGALVVAVTPDDGAKADTALLHIMVADLAAYGDGHGGVKNLSVWQDTGERYAVDQVAKDGYFDQPYGIALDQYARLYVADRDAFGGNGGVIRIDPRTGEQTPISSDRRLVEPTGIVVEASGTILVADAQARDDLGDAVGGIVRIDPATGEQTMISSHGLLVDPTGLALAPDGTIYVADRSAQTGQGTSGAIIRIDPVTGEQSLIASHGQFHNPRGIVVAPNGDLYVVDPDWDGGDGGVIRIPASIAQGLGNPDFHPTIANHSEVTAHDNWGNPYGIVLAPDGSILVADPDYYAVHRGAIVKVDPSTGESTVLTANNQFKAPTGLVVLPDPLPDLPATPPAASAPTTFLTPPDSAPLCHAQQYVVPNGVTRLGFTVTGEPGHLGLGQYDGYDLWRYYPGGKGGFGAAVSGELSVTPGQILYVNVANNDTGGKATYTGESNGGQSSFLSTDPESQTVLTSGRGCDTTGLVVMAGGGGGGGVSFRGGPGDGGDGGVPDGTNGRSGGAQAAYQPGRGGAGATQTAGGAGGPAPGLEAEAGGDGQFLIGGRGGQGPGAGQGTGQNGGGGGGGYYGGGGGGQSDSGGGSGGGGGGGSSYVATSSTSHVVYRIAPTRLSPPSVVLTPLDAPSTMTLSASKSSIHPTEKVLLTAEVTPPIGGTLPTRGIVYFSDEGTVLGFRMLDAQYGTAVMETALTGSLGLHDITATFYYDVSNLSVPNATASTGVTVNAVSTQPTAFDQSLQTNVEPIPVTLNGSGGDDTLVFTVTGGPSHGTLSGTSPYLIYTPEPADYSGPDSFTFTASYLHGGAPASDPATVSIEVFGSNEAPVGVADSVYATAGYPTNITPLANDTDADDDTLTITSMTAPDHGTAELDSNRVRITYTPDAGFTGTDYIYYFATDGTALTAVTTITINVSPAPPVANDDAVAVNRNGSVTIRVLTNDTIADGRTIGLWGELTDPAHGTLSSTIDLNGFIYKPDPGFVGTDSFDYQAEDEGNGATSFPATVTITVKAVKAGAPAALAATGGDAQVDLSWTAPADDGGDPDLSYTLYRSTDSTVQGSAIATGLTGTSYTDATAVNGTTYYYLVTATNSAGESAVSNQADATPAAPLAAPDAPTGLTATGGDSQVVLSWSEPADDGGAALTGYTLYRSTDPASEGSPIASGISGTSYTDLSAVNGTTYYYVVKATNSVGISPASNQDDATPATTPDAPTGLAATAGDSQVDLSWIAPTDDGGSAITGYTVYRSTDPAALGSGIASGLAVTSYADATAVNGTTYYYVVTATNSVGESPASNQAEATPATHPDAPTALTTTGDDSHVDLSWTAPADDGGAALTGYILYRSTDSASEGSPIASGISGTSYTDLSAVNGTTYYYVVKATNSVGISPASNQADATPATHPDAPTGLTAIGGDSQVGLSWTAPAVDGGATITGYSVYRSTDPALQGSALATGISGTTYTDATAVNGTTYYYVVTATNSVGESPASNQAEATPATHPDAPTGLTATAGDAQVKLSWLAPADNGGADLTGYILYRSTDPSVPGSPIASGIPGTSYTDLSAVNGTKYYYVVKASNSPGLSPGSNQASAVPASAGVPGLASTGAPDLSGPLGLALACLLLGGVALATRRARRASRQN